MGRMSEAPRPVSVELRGWPVLCLLPSQAMPWDALSPGVARSARALDADLASMPTVRRALLPFPRGGEMRWPFALRWPPGSPLAGLDARLAAGRAEPADFDRAVACDPRSIWCLTCFASLRLLTRDPAIPRLTPADDDAPAESLGRCCPVCHARLGLPVVELLGVGPGGGPGAGDGEPCVVLNRRAGGDLGRFPLTPDGARSAFGRLDGETVTTLTAQRPGSSLLVAGGGDDFIASWVGDGEAWSLLGLQAGGTEPFRIAGCFELWSTQQRRHLIGAQEALAAAVAFASAGGRDPAMHWELASLD